MASLPVLKAAGLNISPNQLDLPDGSLTTANNVIIRRDNVLESRRGMKLYGTDFGSTSDTAKQLIEYKSRILRHYQTTLEYDTEVDNLDGESIFETFSGTFSEVSDGLRIKSVQANNNLYFTTDDGIKKISAASPDDFTEDDDYITSAGGIKALDISTVLNVEAGETTGFLPNDSTVAYRVVWGIKDANKNLILGTPSQRSVIYHSQLEMMIRDYMRLLGALDSLNQSGSIYTDGDYVNTLKLDINESASDLRTNLIALCEKLDQEQGTLAGSSDIASAAISAGVCTVTFGGSFYQNRQFQVGDKIYLTGFTPATTGTLDGVQTVTAVSLGVGGTITFDTSATGSVSLSSESIESGFFRGITEPSAPSVPATRNNLDDLEDYLDSIIEELQSSNNLREVAKNNASATSSPLELTTVGIAGTTVTVNNDATGDARNFLTTSDLVVLNGTWNDSTGSPISFAGLQTVTGSTATTFTMTISGLTDPGVIDSTSTVDRVLRFTDSLKSTYIDVLSLTTSCNVDVLITVPVDATANHFYQIYRSATITSEGTDVLADLSPSDEMKLVYEDFPTTAELSLRTITVEDIVPEAFFLGATNLYTNEFSGEGILQANDKPPVAHDINVFNNYTFFANTKTLQRKELFLLGVSDILEDYNNGLAPSVTISDGDTTNTYSFVKGVQEVTTVTVNTNIVVSANPGTYFLLNSANNEKEFYVWYKQLGSSTTDPAVTGRTGIQVDLPSGFTQAQVASYTRDKLNQYIDYFSATATSTTTVVTNIDEGPCDNASAGTSTFTFVETTSGAGEKATEEITSITVPAGSVFPSSGTAAYFLLYTPFDRDLYYVWFQVGTSTDPAVSGRTGIEVTILVGDTNAQVATKLSNAIAALDTKFTTEVNSNVVTVTTVYIGPTQSISPTTATGSMNTVTGYSASVTQEGAADVLLSNLTSPSLAVEATSNSLVRVINKNNAEIINAFYLSDANDSPGNFLLETKNISTDEFYILANQTNTGDSFNPGLAPSVITTSAFNTAADPTVVTANSHGLLNGDSVVIAGSTGSIPNINGVYTIMNATTNTFTIDVNVLSVDGTAANIDGAIKAASIAEISDNEEKSNRIYYSKLNQPEAVPIVNYLDVGAQNKAILRIFPLRDSLFVLKEDGLFRISGETAPFTVTLFDSSCIIIAPDSLDVTNNAMYCWTTQGISAIRESGVDVVSREIDTIVLSLNDSTCSYFSRATWGVGYESDNSYTVYTVQDADDTVATIGYRYSPLTQSWTVVDKSYTCGIVKKEDDRLYVGAGDTNFLEMERKNFTRSDYADREYAADLTASTSIGEDTLTVGSIISDLKAGDVVVQEQSISIYNFNQLLRKLDLDSGPADSDYFDTLEAITSDSLRDKLEELADKLDSDTNLSIIETFSPSAVDTGTDIITITAHGLEDDDPVMFSNSGGALPSPLTSTDIYYVISAATDTFQVSLTEGGSAVNFSDQGTGTHTVQKFKYSTAIVNRTNHTITSNSAADPTVITSANHGLKTNRYISISGVSSSSPSIDSSFAVTRIDENTFSIDVDVVTAGTGGTFSTEVSSFEDIRACYNIIIDLINADPAIDFTNYSQVTLDTIQEAIVTDVNETLSQVTLNLELPFIQGPITIYSAIECEVVYAPQTMGDPLGLKHLREASVMFESKAFTNAVLSFSTDLLPEFKDVPFDGSGNGIFGHVSDFGSGFFGGAGNSAPFRTYVPRQCQRCRYINVKFAHAIARERWAIFGITVTGNVGQSTRAYR